jgi:lipopolysaccharide export system permease protein
MRIIDRYINSSILKTFFGTIFIFGLLYIVIDVTSQLDEFIDRKVPFPILLKYYCAFFPVILAQTASIACLISVLLTFSSLNNQNEVVVMRSSGLSFWKITRPALIFALVISAMIFWINEKLIPQSNQITKQIRNDNMILEVDRIRKKKERIKNLTFYGLKNRLYFIDAFDPGTHQLEGVTIIEHDEKQNISQKIVAFKGIWTGIAWKFYQCQITEYDTSGTNVPLKVKVYQEKLMDIKETPEDFLRQRVNVSAMDLRELRNYIDRFSKSGATRALNNLWVDFHQKLAYPFGNFVIVFTGLPFALMVKSRKGMTFTSVGIAVMVGFLYYVVNAVFLAFGKGGLFTPLLASWAAPVFFLLIALILIKAYF